MERPAHVQVKLYYYYYSTSMSGSPLQFPQTFNGYNKFKKSNTLKVQFSFLFVRLDAELLSKVSFVCICLECLGGRLKCYWCLGPDLNPEIPSPSAAVFTVAGSFENVKFRKIIQQQCAQALGTCGHGCNILTRCCHLHGRQR